MAKKLINIPSLVKKLRGHLGDLTQEQFARELGVTFATVNSWENRKRFPQPYLLRKLLELGQQINKNKAKR